MRVVRHPGRRRASRVIVIVGVVDTRPIRGHLARARARSITTAVDSNRSRTAVRDISARGKPSLTFHSRVPSDAVKPSTLEAVSAALTEILREDMNVDIRRVTPESRLIDDVGLDSVAFAVGMVAIEDKLGVALSEEDLLSCDTVGDLEAAIVAKVPAAQANS
jgi:acyl carrier protein